MRQSEADGQVATQEVQQDHRAQHQPSHSPQAHAYTQAQGQAFTVGIRISPQELDEFARHKAREKLEARGCKLDPAQFYARATVRRDADGGVFVGLTE